MADDELAELRRRAYSREGTTEDLRRLAEREAVASPPDDTSAVPDEAIPRDVAEPESVEPERAAPSRRRLALLSGTIGAVAGAVLATLGILLPHGPADPTGPPAPEATALVIFDREPGERDDPARLPMPLDHILPGGLEQADLRWLGSVAESEIYVARGSHDDITTICLISARADTTAAACTEQSEFEVSGLNLGDGRLELRWGPLGTELWVADTSG